MLSFGEAEIEALTADADAAWAETVAGRITEAGLRCAPETARAAVAEARAIGASAPRSAAALAAVAAAGGLGAAGPLLSAEGIPADRRVEMLAALAVDEAAPEPARGDDLFARAARVDAALSAVGIEGDRAAALAEALAGFAEDAPAPPVAVAGPAPEPPAPPEEASPEALAALVEEVEARRAALAADARALLEAGRGGRPGLGSFAGRLARAREAQARLRRVLGIAAASGPVPAAAWRAACRRLAPSRAETGR